MNPEEFRKYLKEINFYSPSRELCIGWIHSCEQARKQQEAESIASGAIREPTKEEWKDLIHVAGLEHFKKGYEAMSEQERQKAKDYLEETWCQPIPTFDEKSESDQNEIITEVQRWIQEAVYSNLGFDAQDTITKSDEYQPLTEDVFASKFSYYELAGNMELGSKIAKEVFVWVKSLEKPLKLVWGQLSYKDGNIIETLINNETIEKLNLRIQS